VRPISCPACDVMISPDHYGVGEMSPCPFCGQQLRIDVFPAIEKKTGPLQVGEAVGEDEASCFYHSEKRAEATCDYCGRFICSLCELELHGKKMCPTCLQAGRQKGKIKNLDRQRTLYDAIALKLSLYPIITIWLTIITAPIALYLAFRHWNSPLGVTRRSKIRLVLSIIFSFCQIGVWSALIIYLIFMG
jgi:hypothetical protein